MQLFCCKLQDRYAVAQALPPVDSSQDWCLISANEKDGYTIMEFKRNFTTCDVKDRDITVNMYFVHLHIVKS